jgi:hypothetical protein
MEKDAEHSSANPQIIKQNEMVKKKNVPITLNPSDSFNL